MHVILNFSCQDPSPLEKKVPCLLCVKSGTSSIPDPVLMTWDSNIIYVYLPTLVQGQFEVNVFIRGMKRVGTRSGHQRT